ncbi:MAG: universal stress protein [Bacteroidetes bacterium]|nr:universal stress protein [Bacteroidota bacterium]
MKTILVPTDFSECSTATFPYAVLIAKKTGAKILLLHVLDVQGNTSDAPYMIAAMNTTKVRMQKLMREPILKGVEVTDAIEVGSISRKVNEAAKKHKADMIVMGTHGASGWHEAFIGSNAERIVRDADVPVLSIKNKIKNLKLENIIYATDFSEETFIVFPIIKKIAQTIGAKLDLMKVVTRIDFETTRETQKSINRFKKKAGAQEHSVFIYYDDVKQEGIRGYANTMKADMIALGTHGRHGLSHFFNGSIAEDLVNHSPLPVLTINIHKKLMKPEVEIQSQKKSSTRT